MITFHNDKIFNMMITLDNGKTFNLMITFDNDKVLGISSLNFMISLS